MDESKSSVLWPDEVSRKREGWGWLFWAGAVCLYRTLWLVHELKRFSLLFYFWWDILNKCKHYPQFSWVWHSTSLEKIVWHFVSLQVWHFVSLQNSVWHSASLHQFLWKSDVWHKSVWHKNIDPFFHLPMRSLQFKHSVKTFWFFFL